MTLRARLESLMAEARDREIWLGMLMKSWDEWIAHVEHAKPAPAVPVAPVRLPRPSTVVPVWKTGGKKTAE